MYSGSKQDNNDGQWVGVEPVPGAMTINIGDMLQVWTNGGKAQRRGLGLGVRLEHSLDTSAI